MVCLNDVFLLSISFIVCRMAKCMSKVHSLKELSSLLEGFTSLTHLRLFLGILFNFAIVRASY